MDAELIFRKREEFSTPSGVRLVIVMDLFLINEPGRNKVRERFGEFQGD